MGPGCWQDGCPSFVSLLKTRKTKVEVDTFAALLPTPPHQLCLELNDTFAKYSPSEMKWQQHQEWTKGIEKNCFGTKTASVALLVILSVIFLDSFSVLAISSVLENHMWLWSLVTMQSSVWNCNNSPARGGMG